MGSGYIWTFIDDINVPFLLCYGNQSCCCILTSSVERIYLELPLWHEWQKVQVWEATRKHLSSFTIISPFKRGYFYIYVYIYIYAAKGVITHNNQSLKGAVDVTLWQNEAEVKFQMDIDSEISLTHDIYCLSSVMASICSVIEMW